MIDHSSIYIIDVDEISLEQLDAHNDCISPSTMSTAPTTTGTCSSQLSVGSTSSSASRQAILVGVVATVEHSFSSLHRLKMYLHSMMSNRG